MSSEKKYRFGYRIHIKVEGERDAIEVSARLKEGEPITLRDVEIALKDAVERATDNFKEEYK